MNCKGLIAFTIWVAVLTTADRAVAQPTAAADARNYRWKVVGVYPHDRDAFTQGLVFEDGILYEGTGRYGHSQVRKIDLASGKVLQTRELSRKYFGEGITVFGDWVIQLTWKAETGFVYDKKRLTLLRTFRYDGQGWGITHDGRKLIISDGSARLRFLDPETFRETGSIEVRDGSRPVARLNELEYIDGRIFANVWQSRRIAVIEPVSGAVLGWLDDIAPLSLYDMNRPVDVLNGIAYDAVRGRIFITGKLWPRLFEIQIEAIQD